jgi:hypothetical protein
MDSESQQRFNNAFLVSGIAIGGAFVAYKYAGLDKKIAVYTGLGVTLGSLVIAELGTLSDSMPYLLAGGGALGLLVFALL